MRITSTALAVAAAVIASIPGAVAQTQQAPVDIIIQQGFSELIDIPGEFQDVAIGDPSIVDAQPITANTLLVNGIDQGTTNIIVIDDAGRALYRARVHVRPVRIWPGYRVNVVHGTRLAHPFRCDRESGCQSRDQGPESGQPTTVFLGETTGDTNAAGGGGVRSAPTAAQ